MINSLRSRTQHPPQWMDLERNTISQLHHILIELGAVPPQGADRDELIRLIKLRLTPRRAQNRSLLQRNNDSDVSSDSNDNRMNSDEINPENDQLDELSENDALPTNDMTNDFDSPSFPSIEAPADDEFVNSMESESAALTPIHSSEAPYVSKLFPLNSLNDDNDDNDDDEHDGPAVPQKPSQVKVINNARPVRRHIISPTAPKASQNSSNSNNFTSHVITSNSATTSTLTSNVNKNISKKSVTVNISEPSRKVIFSQPKKASSIKKNYTNIGITLLLFSGLLFFLVLLITPGTEFICPKHAKCIDQEIVHCDAGFIKVGEKICAPTDQQKVYQSTLEAALYIARIDGDCISHQEPVTLDQIKNKFPKADTKLLLNDADFMVRLEEGNILRSTNPSYAFVCKIFNKGDQHPALSGLMIIITFCISFVIVTVVTKIIKNNH
ncbi:hypothetical protein TRFO_39443 [Tritrichomonas foetus]|uniref:LEM domain-containing protein n=1 Tax=Tritrichomonas foetus TaxID=1144522 RepID=A0A1J4J9P7_9EUKA|nr:hypothetical protein TRFO_39443 [Tritrichomonas foetus]|eukprot:OHS94379.1 hypothetical protein TRFO_39443 [Tritrichomonas foetus]